jgi:inorganic pyrophosphatase
MKATEALLQSIPPREGGLVNVIIDTPRGSGSKLKLDGKHGCLRLSHILPAGHVFPFDFGSIPGTLADDGDALDVLVLIDAPTCPGCLVAARLIGVLTAKQTEKGRTMRNDRLVAVPVTETNRPAIRRLDQLDKARVDEIEHFFYSYNLAHGRRFRPIGRQGPGKAQELLNAAIRKYERQRT